MFALECAMDELAYALKIDPLELRLINYTDVNPDNNKPYSSKALRECYQLASEKFGWKNRKFEPRSMRDGRLLVGWGTATGTWGAFLQAATVKIVYKADGTAHITSAASDIGPGTYTVITMIAAEHLGLSAEKVKFELGDSKFPRAPSQGGSWTTASVGTAAFEAAKQFWYCGRNGQCRLPICRRRVRFFAQSELLSVAGGDGGADSQAPGQADLYEATDVHRQRLSSAFLAESSARREPRWEIAVNYSRIGEQQLDDRRLRGKYHQFYALDLCLSECRHAAKNRQNRFGDAVRDARSGRGFGDVRA
jgi:hypothetical protein